METLFIGALLLLGVVLPWLLELRLSLHPRPHGMLAPILWGLPIAAAVVVPGTGSLGGGGPLYATAGALVVVNLRSVLWAGLALPPRRRVWVLVLLLPLLVVLGGTVVSLWQAADVSTGGRTGAGVVIGGAFARGLGIGLTMVVAMVFLGSAACWSAWGAPLLVLLNQRRVSS
jgi:hypothetical protein